MTGLSDIGIKVEHAGLPQQTAHNALPVLHEIRHALAHLAQTGESTTIDLNAIPFGPSDRERLFEILGQGEISATLNALGESRIDETSYPGVWLIQHWSPGGDVLSRQIEITRYPSLLITPEEDPGESAERLSSYLAWEANNNP